MNAQHRDPRHWDIFCRVVDNFGDIGFSWRLARQLAGEHGLAVRLWVDDLASFERLCPQLDPSLAHQSIRGVEVLRWPDAAGAQPAAEVVIEAFGAEPPESYLAAMAARSPAPVWINLEYLTAEAWAGGCHGLASPHPRLPLTRHFFFPGFLPGSGGLLREAGLAASRDAWQAAGQDAWTRLGLPAPQPGETTISLFGYENPALPGLLSAWANGAEPLRCLISPGSPLEQAQAWLGRQLAANEAGQKGQLRLHALPFLPQERYDQLLWSCELNLVRGEDSLVRALWAARPLAWQPYRQQAAAHLAKLGAFSELYTGALPPDPARACSNFWQAWNSPASEEAERAWREYWRHFPTLRAHARRLATELEALPDLASELVRFCRTQYNSRFSSQDAS